MKKLCGRTDRDGASFSDIRNSLGGVGRAYSIVKSAIQLILKNWR